MHSYALQSMNRLQSMYGYVFRLHELLIPGSQGISYDHSYAFQVSVVNLYQYHRDNIQVCDHS